MNYFFIFFTSANTFTYISVFSFMSFTVFVYFYVSRMILHCFTKDIFYVSYCMSIKSTQISIHKNRTRNLSPRIIFVLYFGRTLSIRNYLQNICVTFINAFVHDCPPYIMRLQENMLHVYHLRQYMSLSLSITLIVTRSPGHNITSILSIESIMFSTSFT